MKISKYLVLGALVMSTSVAVAAGRADAKDRTQSWWYRGTNWVDRPSVQRYIQGSERFARENKDVIKGTAKDAARGRSPVYLVPKGVFGYPKEAR